MSDRVFFSLTGVAIVAMIALALVFPQGDGRRSPKPFGHETTADVQARQARLHPVSKVAPKKPGVL